MAKIAYNRCSRGLGMLDQDLDYLSEPKPTSPESTEPARSAASVAPSPTNCMSSAPVKRSFSISRMLFGSSKSKSSRPHRVASPPTGAVTLERAPAAEAAEAGACTLYHS
ncbi:hypothetical protein GGF32_000777 [Allomyces javanicus]|nr:hypothetical protein GGF32_000777 [Allomyces javanicus]